MFRPDHIKAHDHCNGNLDELRVSETAGCFYCCSIFPATEIEDWVDEGKCALCPKCGIDSVIGSASGYPITKEFLEKMYDYWFSEAS